MPNQQRANDDDIAKGAVEQDRPEQDTNVSDRVHVLSANQDVITKVMEDQPEGTNAQAEAAGGDRPENNQDSQRQRDPDGNAGAEINPEGVTQDQEPGQRQRRNQNDEKDDPLAA